MATENQGPIAKEGYPFIAISWVFTLAGFYLWGAVGASFPFLMTFFCLWFFRDPRRIVPHEEGQIVSPGDGKIVDISSVVEDRFLKKPAIKISIFLNVFNVHVNRSPTKGKVVGIFYNPGKFFAASVPKASLANEQNALLLEMPSGKQIVFIQIAGLIARRIVCWAKIGQSLDRGERFGLIRFGSRMDVFLPPETEVSVSMGDHVKGGMSVLGVLR